MKATFVLLALAAASTATKLEICSAVCMTNAIVASGCSAGDTSCICASDKFLSTVSECAETECAGSDAVLATAGSFCEDAGLHVEMKRWSRGHPGGRKGWGGRWRGRPWGKGPWGKGPWGGRWRGGYTGPTPSSGESKGGSSSHHGWHGRPGHRWGRPGRPWGGNGGSGDSGSDGGEDSGSWEDWETPSYPTKPTTTGIPKPTSTVW